MTYHFAKSYNCEQDNHIACDGEAYCDHPDCTLKHACRCTCHAPVRVKSKLVPDPEPIGAFA